MKGQVFPCRDCTLRCPTRIQPPRIVHRFLKTSPIKLTITQKHNLGPFWNELFDELYQFNMKRFGTMTLGTLTHHPGQRQSTTSIDHVDHQGTTSPTHAAAIHDHYEGL